MDANVCYIFAGRYLGGKAVSATKRYAAYMSPSEKKWEMEKRHRSVMTKKEISETSVKALKPAITSSPRDNAKDACPLDPRLFLSASHD